ncbi:hypothetical protein KY289_017566 [Solanum tuberosum]|nr:hypothetical protein KY289_017566 [Solanum tuberosum]
MGGHLGFRMQLLTEPFSESIGSIFIGTSPRLMAFEVTPIGCANFSIHNWTKSVVHCFFLLLGLPCHVFRSSYKVWFTHFAVFQSAVPACPFGNGDSSMNQVSGVSSVRSSGKVMLQLVSPMLEIETVLNEKLLKNTEEEEFLGFLQKLKIVAFGIEDNE